ncbi:MAG: peptide ABC transporter substrate-binding protein [Bacteroidota bacterium]
MRKLLFLSAILSLLLASCSGPGGNGKEGLGGRVYGGVFRLNETEKYHTFYPYAITDLISANIAYQVYEGLVKFNPGNVTELRPSIAESWTMNDDGTVYTFKLRKDVYFQDDACFDGGKGRNVTAADFKYSFELLCTQSPDNLLFSGTFKDKVKGANEYYAASASGKPSADLEGVKVIDDYTLQITLNAPSSSFLYILASPGCFVVSKEGINKYGNKLRLGTGPFVISNAEKADQNLILVKNRNYYGTDSLGNKLPFLDTIMISFLPTKSKELEAFKNNDLDVVFGLPAESVSEMVESSIKDFKNPPKYVLDRTPELATQYYEFITTRPPFNNVKVRQAFSYAINRDKIIENVLNREAYGPGIYGFCPQSLIGYDVTKIKGYSYDPEKARQLLAEAGYPGGKGFPDVRIELNSGGARHSKVVEEIKNQLKDVLNVNLDYYIVPLSQKMEDAKYARADVFRSAWIADFPSPENFLWVFYGKTVPDSMSKPSWPNIPRYRNAVYDSLFDLGRSAKTRQESYSYFQQAEQVLMNDAPIIVLWHDENMKLAHFHVKNFYFNPMNLRSFSEVYIQRGTAEQKEEPKSN